MEGFKMRGWLVMFCGLLIAGCATAGMRNGVGQARYELERAAATQDEGERGQRLERATAVLAAWQAAYGGAERRIDDGSYGVVLEQMEGEGRWIGAARKWIEEKTGGWLDAVLGGLAAVLSVVSVRLFGASRRHKREKQVLIEEIEKGGNVELKGRIAKRMARLTRFGREVHSTTS